MEYYRFLVTSKIDSSNSKALKQLHRAEVLNAVSVSSYEIYCVLGELSSKEEHDLKTFLFCTELTETCTVQKCNSAKPEKPLHREALTLEVMLSPGVTDTRSREAMNGIREMGFSNVKEIVSGTGYVISGTFTEAEKRKIQASLCNSSIQYCAFDFVEPRWVSLQSELQKQSETLVETFDFASMSDKELLDFSIEKKASLDLLEMQKIKDYFTKLGRPCTDVEFEAIAQTWSEHCVHKTFKSLISIESDDETVKNNYPDLKVSNILKSYFKKATDEIASPWVVSAFVDNAGIVKLDETYDVSFKVETHNHPSAVEPFGGANTGVGGVIRDVMGVSARPFAVTDVLCFGLPETKMSEVPQGSLHPFDTMVGVVKGVSDYGNKMGIPTVNGGIHFDKRYGTNPLVYCGCAGVSKHGKHKTSPQVGDHIFALGSSTGRDAIRGATFSSMVVKAETGTVAGAAVQTGDPIIQKKICEVLDVIIEKELYSAITDCGAGGFSSAIGEMSSKLGCKVDLTSMPVKYQGLKAWERWISESQERMVLAVPEKCCQELLRLCAIYDVQAYDLGTFTGDGILHVVCHGKDVIKLDCSFLHSGPPQRKLTAKPHLKQKPYANYKAEPIKEHLLKLLQDKTICSRESIIRQYDHEVQGGTFLKPYDGKTYSGPQDAAVVQPMEQKGNIAVALSNALCVRYSDFDAYKMAEATIDEAVRSIIAVGGDPDRIGILDNYCMGNPNRPEVMWDLIESARACYDTAMTFKTPFISGKDSFNNEYVTSDGTTVAIPASLLISAMGIVPDTRVIPGSSLKTTGSKLFVFGKTDFQFYTSLFAENFGIPEGSEKRVPSFSKVNAQNYKNLHKAISEKLILSCHDISDGGLLVAVAEMCIGSGKGATLSIEKKLETLRFLFGEGNGCFVVEIADEALGKVTSILGDEYLIPIGSVANEAVLSVKTAKESFSLSVSELKEAFSKSLLD